MGLVTLTFDRLILKMACESKAWNLHSKIQIQTTATLIAPFPTGGGIIIQTFVKWTMSAIKLNVRHRQSVGGSIAESIDEVRGVKE